MTLNPKQQRFVQEYLIDLNATQAAIRAGYEFGVKPLGYYVYLLVDPRDGMVFYVGKGLGRRAESHGKRGARDKTNYAKGCKIEEIRARGQREIILYFATNLEESIAFGIEREMIHAFRQYGLLNISGGTITRLEATTRLADYWLSRLKPREQWVAEQESENWADGRLCGMTPEEFYNKVHAGLAECVVWPQPEWVRA